MNWIHFCLFFKTCFCLNCCRHWHICASSYTFLLVLWSELSTMALAMRLAVLWAIWAFSHLTYRFWRSHQLLLQFYQVNWFEVRITLVKNISIDKIVLISDSLEMPALMKGNFHRYSLILFGNLSIRHHIPGENETKKMRYQKLQL